jgi:hypothetical protein
MGIFGGLFSQKKKPAKKKRVEITGVSITEYNIDGTVKSYREIPASSLPKSTGRPKSIEQLRAERNAEDRHFNQVMDKVNNALQACSDSEWSDESLSEYDRIIAWARKEGVGLSPAHDFRLVNGYIKKGHYDTAWGRLNRMVIDFPDSLSKIRKEMCRICKKEGRWPDALCYLMMSHAAKYAGFSEVAFLKDLKPIARKLSLSDDECKYLAKKLMSLHGDELKRDTDASKVYRKFYKEQLRSRLG